MFKGRPYINYAAFFEEKYDLSEDNVYCDTLDKVKYANSPKEKIFLIELSPLVNVVRQMLATHQTDLKSFQVLQAKMFSYI